jgi:hypothetical protein
LLFLLPEIKNQTEVIKMEGETQLFTQNDNGEYEAYTPPAFQETIPETLRENVLFKEITDTGQLAEKLVELHGNLPQRPESPEHYKVEVPESFPVVEGDLNNFKKVAYDMGLTAEQFRGLMGHYFEREMTNMDKMREEIKTHREESMNALKMEYGDATDQKISKAAEFIRTIGGKMGEGKSEEFNRWLDDTKFGDDPMVIRLFAAAAELISEDVVIQRGGDDASEKRPIGSDGKHRLRFKSMGE